MLTTATARASMTVRATPLLLLALTLALLWGACAVPAPAATAGGAAPAQPRIQPSGSGAGPADEIGRPGDGACDSQGAADPHRDRRRAALAPAGPPGPPAVAVQTAPRTDPPDGRRGIPDSRPRLAAAPGPAVLQVFLC
ncbi:hypothetical protein ABZ135_35875 [Streptomyces sp. NPDC006339]|uniref:hypothetical protein n=1 Tax=Streptomyces sp. NPDC006339 TaxID=3156755 RepID=UPI0033A2F892